MKLFIRGVGCLGLLLTLVGSDSVVAESGAVIEIDQVASTFAETGTIDLSFVDTINKSPLGISNGTGNQSSVEQNSSLSSVPNMSHIVEETVFTSGGNKVVVMQNNEVTVSDISVDGKSNNVSITQNKAGVAINMQVSTGNHLVCNIN